jgi:hypothetical protein
MDNTLKRKLAAVQAVIDKLKAGSNCGDYRLEAANALEKIIEDIWKLNINLPTLTNAERELILEMMTEALGLHKKLERI